MVIKDGPNSRIEAVLFPLFIYYNISPNWLQKYEKLKLSIIKDSYIIVSINDKPPKVHPLIKSNE